MTYDFFTVDEIKHFKQAMSDKKRDMKRLTPMMSIWVDMCNDAAIRTAEHWAKIVWDDYRMTKRPDFIRSYTPIIMNATALYISITCESQLFCDTQDNATLSREILRKFPDAPVEYIRMFMDSVHRLDTSPKLDEIAKHTRMFVISYLHELGDTGTSDNTLENLNRRTIEMVENVRTPGYVKVGTGTSETLRDIESRIEDHEDSVTVEECSMTSLDKKLSKRDSESNKRAISNDAETIDVDIIDIDMRLDIRK